MAQHEHREPHWHHDQEQDDRYRRNQRYLNLRPLTLAGLSGVEVWSLYWWCGEEDDPACQQDEGESSNQSYQDISGYGVRPDTRHVLP
jgi:hypothetical protein